MTIWQLIGLGLAVAGAAVLAILVVEIASRIDERRNRDR